MNARDPDTTEAALPRGDLPQDREALRGRRGGGGRARGRGAAGARTPLAAYGRHLGTAYQLVDDVLDYRSNPKERGKNLGDDLAEGKPTLPLIHALKNGSGRAARRDPRGDPARRHRAAGTGDRRHRFHRRAGVHRRSSRASSPNRRSRALGALPDSPYRSGAGRAGALRSRAHDLKTSAGLRSEARPWRERPPAAIAPRRTLPLDCATPTQRTYS